MNNDNPNPREVIDKAINANIARIRTTFLAEVIEYRIRDNGYPVVDIRPIVKGRDNNGNTYDRAVLFGLPYCPPSGAGFVVYVPLAVGDVVECAALERSADEYMQNGSKNYAAVDPRRHDENDAIVLNKVRDFNAEYSNNVVQNDNLIIAKIDGSCRFEIRQDGSIVSHSADVRLGSAAATQAVALAPEVLAQLADIASALNILSVWYSAGVAAATAIGSPQPALFVPSAPTPNLITPALNGATKVKAE
jgi:hypothetical protein